MRNRALSVILTVALVCGALGGAFAGIPAASASPTTELYLSPSSGTRSTEAGDFSVTVMLNSGGEAVNAVAAYLTFDAALLSVSTITGGSAFPVEWPTAYDNDAGTIDINRTCSGANTFNGTGSVATIAFHPKSAGTASVQISLASSAVVRAADTVNVLSIAGSGSYTLVSPGITLSTSTVSVTEGGAGSSYTLVLTAPPTADVTITASSDTQVTASPGTLTFTSGNWSSAQTVTVNAVDDAVGEGAHTGTISHAVTSTDSAYNGMAVGSVTANITDNDYTLTYSAGTGGSITAPATSPTTHTSGAIVTITAVANAGYHFVNWTGDVAAVANVNAASTTITMSANYAIQANFAGHDTTITVASAGNGTVTPVSPFIQTYGASGTAITASPAAGYHFVSWSATSNPTYVTIASPTSASTSVTTTSSAPDGGTATVTATFAANTYTVTFDGNGGGTPSPTSKQVTYDATYGTLATVTRTGYTFTGWFTATSGGTQVTSATTVTITAPQTLYAQWTANTYTVTFDGNGGGTPSPTSKQVTYDATYGTLATVTRTGYTFTGWFTATSGGTQVTSATTVTITAPQTLYAQWTANTYTVTFDGNGGGTPSPTSKQVTYDATYGTLATVTRTGYTFTGWFTATSGGTQVTSATTVTITAPQTLYAQWTANTYTVTFDGNGGGTPSPTSKQVTYDATYGTLATVTRTGYTFTGWFTATSGGTQVTSATTVTITAPQTLYAQWTANTYTVTFDGNGGGTPSPTSKQVTYDATYGTLATVTRTGYTFTGWFTATSGGTQVTSATTVTITAPQTLYAQWTLIPTYTVTYNSNGGTGAQTDLLGPYATGVTVTVLGQGTMARTGYTFSGWNTAANGSGTAYAASATFAMGTANVTLYAQWTANTYTVTFDGNGGGTPSPTSKQVTYDATYGTLATVTRTGYTFTGWFTATSGGTQVTSATTVTITAPQTLYAQWTLIPTYTVTYNSNGGTGAQTDLLGPYATGVTVTVLGQGTMARTGYTFSGWNTAANGSGTAYAASATFAMGTANVTLYAQWTLIPTYTVTYNSNGGTGAQTDLLGPYATGVTVTVLGQGTMARTGYTFSGWNTAANGSGTAYAASATFAMGTANVTLYAQWTANTYTLSTGQIGNGSVSKNPSQVSYDHGTVVQLTATPDPGWHFTGWSGDLGGSTNPGTITMDANKTVTATFAPNDVTITVASGGNGTVTPVSPFTQTYGASGTAITASPASGYHFVSWSATSNPTYVTIASPTSASTSVTTTSTAPDGGTATVTATFAPNDVTITVASGGNGTVTPVSPFTQTYGAVGTTITASPASGYHFVSWSATSNPSYVTIASPTSASTSVITTSTAPDGGTATVTATFAPNDVTITVASGGNGTVTPVSPFTQTYGAVGTTITASPASGYHFVSWSATSNPTYVTIASPTSASTSVTTTSTAPDGGTATVTATFAINTYTIVASATAGGSITPAGNVTVNHGASQSFTIAPSIGYHIEDVLVDGSTAGAVSSHTFTNVTAGHTISASFAINTYTLTYSAGTNGHIDGTTPQTVNYGASGTQVTATPDAGYHFVQWSDNVMTASRTDTNVTANISVTASFAINTYTLTVNVTGSGSVTKDPNQATYNHGTSVELTATAALGWYFAGWSGSITGITNPANVTMDGNKTITASFVQRAVIVSPTSVTVSESGAGAEYSVWLSEQPSANVTVSVTCSSAATVSTASLTFTTVNWSVAQSVTVTAVDDAVVEGTHHATVTHASTSADTSYSGLSVSSVSVTILDNDHYSVTASVSGGHGSLSPGLINCDPGDTASFTLIPESGYHIASIVDNGIVMPIANPYVISSVQASHSIIVTYHINVYTITVQVGGLGTVTPSGTVSVEHGASQTFRIEPAAGWILAEVQVDGVSVLASSIVAGVYTMTGITASHRLTVLFGTFGDLIAPLLTTYGPDAHVAQGTPGTVPATPMFQHTMNTGEFDLRIVAQDAGGSVRVVVLNDGMLISEGLIEGEETQRLVLPDGSHDVVVKAFDIAGNMSAVLFRVVVDTVGPVITMSTMPATVSASSVTVRGSAEDLVTGVASVRVNGVDVSAVGGTFERKLNLVAGANAIVVEATDGAGNTSTTRLTVTYKPIPVVTPMVIQLTIDDYWMRVDNRMVKLDAAPVIKYSRTMVPIRAIVEAIGGTISWDAVARKVTIVHKGTTIELWIGKNVARVNGKAAAIDPNDVRVIPFIVNGRTMLPLRFVAETLGLDVEWDGILRRVTLTYWR